MKKLLLILLVATAASCNKSENKGGSLTFTRIGGIYDRPYILSYEINNHISKEQRVIFTPNGKVIEFRTDTRDTWMADISYQRYKYADQWPNCDDSCIQYTFSNLYTNARYEAMFVKTGLPAYLMRSKDNYNPWPVIGSGLVDTAFQNSGVYFFNP